MAAVPYGGFPSGGRRGLVSPAAVLAIVGGLGMCFVVFWALVYLPLHYHESLNFGDSLRFGDVLALLSGAAAIGVGVLALGGRIRNPRGAGGILGLAGAPTLILTILWAYPETFHLSLYPVPFYVAHIYFVDFGVVRIGSGEFPLPLVGSVLAVIAGGALMALSDSPKLVPVRVHAGIGRR